MEALADCIIPPDPETPGGKDAGCAVFVDRQLAGPYGRQEGLYLRPPFQSGAKTRGISRRGGRHKTTARDWPRSIVSARSVTAEGCLQSSRVTRRSKFLRAIEIGRAARLDGVDGKSFFAQVVKDVQMGFFADPLYGGQSRLGRVEDDRLSGRPLQLS